MSDNSKKIDDIKYWAMVNHQGVYPSVSFSKSEFDWLIEQAEKVERYEKALMEILEEGYEEAGTHPDTGFQLDTFITKTARKALNS